MGRKASKISTVAARQYGHVTRPQLLELGLSSRAISGRSHRRSFERDRERDAATLAAGHVTVRITWERLGHEAGHEAVRLHEILNARRRAA